jgi:hypothetical protein
MNKIFGFIIILSVSLCTNSFSQNLSGINIGIVHSELTKKLIYPDNNNFYPIQNWELFFLNRKISYTVISDDDLENRELADLDVLILPSVEVLSQKASDKLNDFLHSGKGLLVFGKLGTYNQNRTRNKSDFLLKNSGFSYKELNTGDNISEFHTLNISSVIGRGFNYDDELQILNQYPPLVTENIGKNVKTCGQYILNDDIEKNGIKSSIVFSEKSNGRIAWIGFQLSQIGSTMTEGSIIEKLIFNSIEWISQTPVVMLNPLPENFNFPVLFTNIITDDNSISPEIIERFESADTRMNFFLEAVALDADDDKLKGLTTVGDINLFLNLDFSGSSINDITLDRIYNKLYEKCSQDYFGIKINNTYSEKLPAIFLESRFDFYSLADEKILLSEPGNSNGELLKRLPIKIAYHLVSGKDEASVIETISSLKDEVIQNEKMLILGFINQLKPLGNFESLNYLSAITEYLKTEGAWITTYSGLINWVSSRKNVIVTTKEAREKNNYEIKVENRNQTDVNNIILALFSPAGKNNPRLTGSNFNIEYDRKSGSYFITIPFIGAGTQEIINVQFDNRNFLRE